MKNIKACLTSNSVDYKTPKNLYELFTIKLKAIDLFPYKATFNQFDREYKNQLLFCNPPFKDMKIVVEYLYKLHTENNCEIWLLCPVRTDTKWFNKITSLNNEIYFFNHRLKYNDLTKEAPFPSCLIHIEKTLKNNNTYHKCSLESFINDIG